MNSIQIAVSEIWVVFILAGILFLYRKDIEQSKTTKYLLWACIVRLISDAGSWAFDGYPGPIWGIITRLSNYLTFTFNDLVNLAFTVYVWSLIRKRDEKTDRILCIYSLIAVTGVICLTAGVFFGWFYTFDADNLYSRGPYYAYTHVSTVCALATTLWLLVRYRGRFSRTQKFLTWGYFILMIGATVYELMEFGLSVQTYVQTLSSIIAFLIGDLQIRDNMLKLLEEDRVQKMMLEEAKNAAEAANIAKTSFLFNMSHDIRTPMNAIVGFADLLKKHQTDSEKRNGYIKKIQDSAILLMSILNSILEMARIEKGTLKTDEQAWSVKQFNDMLLSVFHEQMRQKNIEFQREISISHEYVFCDHIILKKIFLNILGNAMKYTEAGGKVLLKLEELPSEREGYAVFRTTVTDTGIGMTKEFLPHIFDEFSRENNSTSNRIEGSGLGMPIVKKLVDLLGGSIEVESEKGKGSSFSVTLQHRTAERKDLKVSCSGKLEEYDFSGSRILLAEDNDFNAEIAIELLQEAGLAVERAENGALAADMVNRHAPHYYDAVLMDIQMPVMNGYEAAERIRKLDDAEKADIPIVALTANAFEEDRRAALEAGMNGHLAKPIDIRELMQLLTQIIKQ